jgi:hypothetical protein
MLISELHGSRIPGEKRSMLRRPIGWIAAGLIALLLLALLISDKRSVPIFRVSLSGDARTLELAQS